MFFKLTVSFLKSFICIPVISRFILHLFCKLPTGFLPGGRVYYPLRTAQICPVHVLITFIFSRIFPLPIFNRLQYKQLKMITSISLILSMSYSCLVQSFLVLRYFAPEPAPISSRYPKFSKFAKSLPACLIEIDDANCS